jgi:hypothetical protein
MALLFFATGTEGTGQLVWNLYRNSASEYEGEFYGSIETLARKLRHPRDEHTIAVILAGSRKDLIDILAIRDLLDGLRVILILPDREEDTVSQGLTLRPSFLTCVDSDFSMAEAVLKKMLSNHYAEEAAA